MVVASRYYLYEPRKLRGSIHVEMSSGWWVSTRLLRALQRALPEIYVKQFGNRLRIGDVLPADIQTTAGIVVSVLNDHPPNSGPPFDLPPPLARGLATCHYVDGFEKHLTLDEIYLIREIPNVPGHIVVFRPGRTPLVGIHLDRFELLQPKI